MTLNQYYSLHPTSSQGFNCRTLKSITDFSNEYASIYTPLIVELRDSKIRPNTGSPTVPMTNHGPT